MPAQWSILYRGPLTSCNYACGYCPFAKRKNTRAELRQDAECLQRFVQWVAERPEQIGVLFTPWGEGLIHKHYQSALCELSRCTNVWRVAIQTNLSCQLDWLAQVDRTRVGLWCTFHPTEISLSRFLERCRILDDEGIRYSVGMVGTREAIQFVEPLRSGLNENVYFWINAFKRNPDYYTQEEVELLTRIDPLFPFNNTRHSSLGRACRTGHQVFTVDGDGNMHRCHFVQEVIGNIYEPGFEAALRPRPCPATTCGCHIGYVHLEDLGLASVFGEGLLERIPVRSAWRV